MDICNKIIEWSRKNADLIAPLTGRYSEEELAFYDFARVVGPDNATLRFRVTQGSLDALESFARYRKMNPDRDFQKAKAPEAIIEIVKHLRTSPFPSYAPAPQQNVSGSRAIEDVINERRRQIEVEDFDASYDDMATKGQLAAAAATYAYSTTLSDRHRQYVSGIYSIENSATLRELWPPSWDKIWWKPTDRRRDLVKAAALLIAEIERLDRAALATEGKV